MVLKYLKILLIVILFILNSCDGCGNNSKGNLNSGEPYFQVELKPESTSLFTDQTVRIRLDISFKGEKKSKDYKIRDIEVTKGKLLYSNPDGSYPSEPRRIEAGNNFNWRADKTQQLIFKPNGEIGQATISLTLADFEGHVSSTSLNLEIKPTFKIELHTYFDSIFTNQAKQISLNIISNDESTTGKEYIVKKIETAYGELQFANGEVIKFGSKFKHGEQQLIFKAQKELGEEILQKGYYLAGRYYPGKAKGMIKLTLEGTNENERSTEIEFEVIPVIFYVDVANIRWNKFEIDHCASEYGWSFGFGEGAKNKLLDEGFAELDLKIKDTKDAKYAGCSDLQTEFGEEAWKLADWKCSDGSPVTIVDLAGNELAEFPLSDSNLLYFKLDNIKLGVSATLMLSIEGPCGTMQEVTIELPVGRKAMLLDNKLSQFLKTTQELNEKIVEDLSLNLSYHPSEVGNARELSQKAREQIDYFEKASKQIGDPKKLAKLLPTSSLEKLKEIYVNIQELKSNKAQLDTYYNL